ncbi:MAG: VCBS repeat-containing protein [Planctomycetota bacterium]
MLLLVASLSAGVPVSAAQERWFSPEVDTALPYVDDLRAGAVCDLDGDGDLDLALAGSTNSFFSGSLYTPLVVLLNSGEASFGDNSGEVQENHPVASVALVDVEGDGDPDIVGTGSGETTVWLNDGAASFKPASGPSPFTETSYSHIHADDFDGDGNPDVALFTFAQPSDLHFADGAGSFSPIPAVLPVETQGMTDTRSGDLDGDGDVDLAGTDLSDPFVLFNDGTGAFPTVLAPYTGFEPSPRGLDFGDVDQDGDLDVLVGAASTELFGGNLDRLLVNDGVGGFTVQTLPQAGTPCFDVALRDLDGDGDLDALTGDSPAEVLLGDGSGNFVHLPGAVSGDPTGGFTLLLGDFDDDGDIDFVDDTRFPERAALHLNDGTAHFRSFTGGTGFYFDELGSRVTAGDYDGDGDADLLGVSSVLLSMPGEIILQRNDGTGSFTEDPGPQPFNPYIVETLETADLDGDSDLDVFVGNTKWTGLSSSGVGISFLLLNDGSASFAISNAVPQVGKNTWEVMLGDVDQDGDLDALMANGTSNPAAENQLWLNNGAATFTPAPFLLPFAPGHSFSGELADFDSDGDLDAVLGQARYVEFPAATARNLYFEWNGASFVDQSGNLPDQFEYTRRIESGDVDGDGDLDLVLGNSEDNDIGAGGGPSQPDRLYLNDGAGVFTDVTGIQFPVVEQTTERLALLDADGDSDLDVISAPFGNLWSGAVVYENDGTGTFSVAEEGRVLLDSDSELVQADVDRDGDIDLLSSNSISYGMQRHLSWRSVARPGYALELEIFGPAAGELWSLAFSNGTLQFPLPPFGILFLDPGGAFGVFGGGTLDGDRRAYAAGALPPEPATVGVTLYFQAAVGNDLLFTNLTRVTLVDS